MSIRLYTFILIILGCVNHADAQFLKYSNEFLSMGVGARASAMGSATLASVDDATAAYWNPAGLLGIKNNVQIALMHNEQFAGIVKHDYGTVAFKFDDKSALAISAIRVGVDDIPNTLNLFQNGQLDYSRIQNFSAIDYAFLASYARDLGIENLTVGANVKIIRRIVGEFANAWGFGFDVGAQYKYRNWMLGAMLRDATTTFNAWSFTFTDAQKQVLQQTNNKLPENALELTAPKLQLGIGRRWEFFDEKLSVLPEVNVDLTIDGQRNVLISNRFLNLDPRMGLELGYKEVVFLRGGMMNLQQQTDFSGKQSYTVMPTVGVGLHINNFAVDYALSNVGSSVGLPYSNVISVRLGINRQN
jgi:hypothetical protein